QIYRKRKEPEKLWKILGDFVAKAGSLDLLGDEAKSLLADGELVKSLIETARRLKQKDAAKLDYGMRLAAALLATENKQYDVAAEFYALAEESVQSDSKKRGEVLL